MNGYSLDVQPVASMPDFFTLTMQSGDINARIVIDRAGVDALQALARDAVAQSELLKRNPH